MITRRRLLAGFAAGALIVPGRGRAQPTKPARIGRLSPLSAEADDSNLAAFRRGLRELGWVEGQHYTIETRFADGNGDRLPALSEREEAARALHLQVRVHQVRDLGFDRAFAAIRADRSEALMVLPDATLINHRQQIVDQAARSRLPAVYGEREFVDAGGLMFYGASLADMYKHAALYADKILKGAKPADLPIEQPTKLELVVNLKTARTLGLTIPPEVLERADHVVE